MTDIFYSAPQGTDLLATQPGDKIFFCQGPNPYTVDSSKEPAEVTKQGIEHVIFRGTWEQCHAYIVRIETLPKPYRMVRIGKFYDLLFLYARHEDCSFMPEKARLYCQDRPHIYFGIMDKSGEVHHVLGSVCGSYAFRQALSEWKNTEKEAEVFYA